MQLGECLLRDYTTHVMRPLRGLTWWGTAYVTAVILVGAAIVPLSLMTFPIRSADQLLKVVYLGALAQLAAFMPIRWRRGSQTVDTMPLVALALLAPGVGPSLAAWLCKFDGRWPSERTALWQLLFNRAKTAIEIGIPSMAIALIPLPGELDIPVRTAALIAGTLLIGYPLTANGFALMEKDHFWRVLSANIGLNSIRSQLILCIGGGALFMVLTMPGGFIMGLGMFGLLFAVRSNMADAQRQQIERFQTLELMAQALDARDPMTESHSQRVSQLATRIAQVLGLGDLEIERIRVAGLLHDIGKIGVPDSVLKKPSGLDPDEWVMMRRHADIGADMIATHSALLPLEPWVRHHHERWDGSGYPGGLIGDAIPLGARIIAVADSFDTITGPRVYRRTSMSTVEAVEDISRYSGVLYDPTAVNALRQINGLPPLVAAPDRVGSEGGLFRLLARNGRFRAFGAGMSISSLGDPLTTVAVTVSAYSVTHSGLGVAAAMILRALAVMVTGIFLAGAADRLPRTRLVVTADMLQFVTLAATPIMVATEPRALFVAVVVLGSATALSQAGRDAGVAALVRHSQIGLANSVVATGTTIGKSAGYPLAALIIWLGGSTFPLFLADAATFAAAALLTVMAGPLGGGIRSTSITGAFRSALALVETRSTLIIAAAGAFAVSMTVPALVVLAYEFGGSGARTYTLLEVVITGGMAVGAMLFATLAHQARAAVAAGLLTMGVLSVAIFGSTNLTLTVALLFAASVGNQLYFVGNRTELQRRAPADRLGSVMAARGVLAQSLAIFGGGLGGVLCTALGARPTYGVAGALLALLGVATILFARRRSDASRESSGDEADVEVMPVASSR